MVEVADHVCKAGALGRLKQQERLQSSRCMKPRDTKRGQVWHPVQQGTIEFGGGEGKKWEAERQRGCLE